MRFDRDIKGIYKTFRNRGFFTFFYLSICQYAGSNERGCVDATHVAPYIQSAALRYILRNLARRRSYSNATNSISQISSDIGNSGFLNLGI